LNHFLEDLKDPTCRNLQLDREVIRKLTEFLLKCDDSKRIALYCSLDWLNCFIDFFREDFLALISKLELEQAVEEETKDAKEELQEV
jgi:hypothetical protein